jgi:hypothetical protein
LKWARKKIWHRASLLNSPQLRFVGESWDQALREGRIHPILGSARESSVLWSEGEDFEHGSAKAGERELS